MSIKCFSIASSITLAAFLLTFPKDESPWEYALLASALNVLIFAN